MNISGISARLQPSRFQASPRAEQNTPAVVSASVQFGNRIGEIDGKSISEIIPAPKGYQQLPAGINADRINNWPQMEMYATSSPKYAAWGLKLGLSRKPTILGIDGRGVHWDISTSVIGPQTYQNDMTYSDIQDIGLRKGRFSNELIIRGVQDGTLRFQYLEKETSEKLYDIIKQRYQFYTNKQAVARHPHHGA